MLNFFLLIPFIFCSPLDQIEHVIIWMQENRAFDHYYGSLRGVRGWNDNSAIGLPSGKSVFFQPVLNQTIPWQLPWHLDRSKFGVTCIDAPEMDYPTDIAMWNFGKLDAWNTARAEGMGMGYFTRSDMPYYYALADGFTICDHYFQSTLTETNPNRLHLFSGSNGLSVGKPPVLDNTEPTPGWNWTTMAEVLEDSKISWKVYQQLDNFDDNGFAWFSKFQQAKPGSPWYDKGMTFVDDLATALGNDMKNGNLPQVSWVVGPTAWSEHASYQPPWGERLTSTLIDQLKQNPEIYSKTAFLFMYDEGGQFFDHLWNPTPPINDGKSTVSTEGEVWVDQNIKKPIGLGFRVPLMVISPWTRGGFVNSEVFDHTSILKFLEKKFNIHIPTISPWRRAITGDLTSIFDFSKKDLSWPNLPNTSNYVEQSKWECSHLPRPSPPIQQTFPIQEKGTRPSRRLQYSMEALGKMDSQGFFELNLINSGALGTPFVVFDRKSPLKPPRKYTVEAGKSLSDRWQVQTSSFDYVLYGPNGWMRSWTGPTKPFEQALPTFLHPNREGGWYAYEQKVESTRISFKGRNENFPHLTSEPMD